MRNIRILALLALCFTLCGCSQNRLFANYRELDQTELIQTMGMDKTDGQVGVTVATAVQEDGTFTIFTGRGQTVAKALSQIHTYPTKKYLFFGHITNLLIGTDMCNDMSGVLDFIERSSDLRLDTPFFVVRGCSTRELMEKAKVDGAGVTELLQPLTDESNLGSDNHVFTTKEIISVLSEEGYALVYAVQLTEDNDKISEGEANVVPAGYGVIRGERVIGYVEYEDCLGVNILINEAVNGVLELPDGKGGFAAVSLANSKCEVEGVFAGDTLKGITVKITTSANIEQLQNSLDLNDEKVIGQLEGELSRLLYSYCQRAIDITRDLSTDFLGFGKRVQIDRPLAWRKIADSWDTLYPAIPIEIKVDAVIERTYDIMHTGGVE